MQLIVEQKFLGVSHKYFRIAKLNVVPIQNGMSKNKIRRFYFYIFHPFRQ